jgi:alpha-amylase
MNWSDLARGGHTAEVLSHWRKLGRFRRAHPAVGAGRHRTLQASPLIFSRILDEGGIHDRVLIAMDQGIGAKTIPVFDVFADGTALVDSYSGMSGRVKDGQITLTTQYGLVLLGTPRQGAPRASPS